MFENIRDKPMNLPRNRAVLGKISNVNLQDILSARINGVEKRGGGQTRTLVNFSYASV